MATQSGLGGEEVSYKAPLQVPQGPCMVQEVPKVSRCLQWAKCKVLKNLRGKDPAKKAATMSERWKVRLRPRGGAMPEDAEVSLLRCGKRTQFSLAADFRS